MKRAHALLIALVIGFAAVAGLVAATRTAALGQPAQQGPSAAQISTRIHALNRTEVALKKALKQQPPKLPPLPAPASASTPSAGPAAGATRSQPAQRVVYVRPAPIVRTVPRAGGEHENENEGDGDGGSEHEDDGGFDD